MEDVKEEKTRSNTMQSTLTIGSIGSVVSFPQSLLLLRKSFEVQEEQLLLYELPKSVIPLLAHITFHSLGRFDR